jgi:hypothetical protein
MNQTYITRSMSKIHQSNTLLAAGLAPTLRSQPVPMLVHGTLRGACLPWSGLAPAPAGLEPETCSGSY